jgi:hypothetical protein
VLLGGGAGFALALVACRRARPLLAVGLIGGITYLLLGVADLSLLDRYLLLPAIVLAFGFAYAVTGWAAQTGWARAGVGGRRGRARGVRADRGSRPPARPEDGGGPRRRERRARREPAPVRRQRDAHPAAPALRSRRRPRSTGRHAARRELGVPVDRVVDARRAAVAAGDVFVTVDDRTMREEQPALFPAHPTPPAAAPPAGFRVIAAHEGWRALAGPACR